jgi:molybdopterin-guanine dinucleotide biosynthesis protein A
MGADKAAIELAGRTLLERAALEVESIASATYLACGPSPRYAELGRPLALDAWPEGGPLAGLEAGLALCETEYLAALACDMPRAAAPAILALRERAEESGLDACLLETEGGVEPRFAVYRRSCLAAVRAALAAGERKMTAFLRFPGADGALPRVGSLPERELPGALAHVGVARNLNTPEELLLEIDLESWAGGAR